MPVLSSLSGREVNGIAQAAVWPRRRPPKAEATGSNPVGAAGARARRSPQSVVSRLSDKGARVACASRLPSGRKDGRGQRCAWPLNFDSGLRPECATTGHSLTAWRTGQVDPKAEVPTPHERGRLEVPTPHERGRLSDPKRKFRVVQESIASKAFGGDGDAEHCCGSLVSSLVGLRTMARAKHVNLARQYFQQRVAIGLIHRHCCRRGQEIAAHARGHVSRVAARLPLVFGEVVSSRWPHSDKRCEHSGKRARRRRDDGDRCEGGVWSSRQAAGRAFVRQRQLGPPFCLGR